MRENALQMRLDAVKTYNTQIALQAQQTATAIAPIVPPETGYMARIKEWFSEFSIPFKGINCFEFRIFFISFES